MLDPILIIIFIYLIVVAFYSDLNQPIRSVIMRDTTDRFDTFYTNQRQKDFSRLHEYALLSAAAYGKKSYEDLSVHIPEKRKKNNYISPEPEMLESLKHTWKTILADQTKSRIERAKSTHGMFVGAFRYEVFERSVLNDDGKREIVVAFKGTSKLSDFFSNLHFITKLIPGVKDQYSFVRDEMPGVMAEINSNYGDQELTIVVTGHSLGGGLAQLAAYSADNIHKVYAFAPSFITGFYDVEPKKRRIRKQFIVIYRIHERGEILAYFRRFLKTIYPVEAVNPTIIELRFNFRGMKENFIYLHSMLPLAISLRDTWLLLPESETYGRER